MEEKNKLKQNNFKLFYILLLIIVAVVAFLLGDLKYSTGDTSNENDTETYSIKYTSIDFDDDYTYAYFEIKNEKNLTIYAGDFAVQIDNLPIKAELILTGYTNTIPIYGGNLDVDNQTIKIRFNKKRNELDSPVTFLYKGTKLELGKAIEFKY